MKKKKKLFDLMVEGPPTPENEQEERDMETFFSALKKRQKCIENDFKRINDQLSAAPNLAHMPEKS